MKESKEKSVESHTPAWKTSFFFHFENCNIKWKFDHAKYVGVSLFTNLRRSEEHGKIEFIGQSLVKHFHVQQAQKAAFQAVAKSSAQLGINRHLFGRVEDNEKV